MKCLGDCFTHLMRLTGQPDGQSGTLRDAVAPPVQATEGAQQWEKRAQQLQQKYGKVDLAEHQRVQAQLKAAQTELSQIRAEGVAASAELASVREELTKVHALYSPLYQSFAAQIAAPKLQTSVFEGFFARHGMSVHPRCTV